MIDPRYLIESESFKVCRLLSTDAFISYCDKRNVKTSREQLERFERLGLLYPLARVRHPKIRIKIEYVDEGRAYRDLGILEDGEAWTGDVKDGYASFSFEKTHALDWLVHGYLWAPESRPFEEWGNFLDKEGGRHTESFYSIFQCYMLYQLMQRTRVNLHLDWFSSCTKSEIQEWVNRVKASATRTMDLLRQHRAKEEMLVTLCQAIANRYYPRTQSDRRTIRITHDAYEWSWREYCRTWDGKKVLADLGISAEELKRLYENVALTAKSIDPLAAWEDLVSFVAVDEKHRLKHDALLAQSCSAMAEMLRFLYEEVTGEKLRPPDAWGDWEKDDFYGAGVTENILRFLEFLTNRFHLNPRPKLILVVEGDGEAEQLPSLVGRVFGSSFSRLGVEVFNLEGVGNFTGDKTFDKYGALEKFIDYHHSRQTIVFVILDNEGRVLAVRDRLIRARSRFNLKRTVTKREYFHVWNLSIEFDNFSHDEIAHALTELCGGQYHFSAAEIAECERRQRAGEGDQLKRLFQEKVDARWSKVDLLKLLFSLIMASPAEEVNDAGEPKRPLVRLMKTVVALAVNNYQPIRLATWEANQEPGYLGHPLK